MANGESMRTFIAAGLALACGLTHGQPRPYETVDEFAKRIASEAAHTVQVRDAEERLAAARRIFDACVRTAPSHAEQGGCGVEYARYLEAQLRDVFAARLRVTAADNPGNPRLPVAERAAQRAWIAYRAAECEAAAISMNGGTGTGDARSGCIVDLTVARIRWFVRE